MYVFCPFFLECPMMIPGVFFCELPDLSLFVSPMAPDPLPPPNMSPGGEGAQVVLLEAVSTALTPV